jgi:hypothetical protein
VITGLVAFYLLSPAPELAVLKKDFLNRFAEVPHRSIIVCFLSLLAKAGLNLPPFEINCL